MGFPTHGPLRAVVLGVALALAASFGVEAASRCETCKAEFTKEYFVVEDMVRRVKRHVCEKCSKSDMVCSACDLAVHPKTMLKLEDGRLLCELDAKGAILSEDEARNIFNEVKRDVQTLLSHWPPLPDRNITVHLVNRDQFVKEYRRSPGFDHPEKLLGLTRSRLTPGTPPEHTIYLLNGVLKPQLVATCAHEYTHTWLHEHEKRTRQLDKDTVEGFCEFISWKLCALRNETNEIKRLLASDYTHGQIHALIAAEEKYPFHRVISWIHEGEDSWLDKDKLERLLAVKREDEPAAAPAWVLPVTVPAPVPDTLTLKGISGAPGRRFALINDRTFARHEEGKVRVGRTHLTIRVEDIHETSVRLRIQGQADVTELALPEQAARR